MSLGTELRRPLKAYGERRNIIAGSFGMNADPERKQGRNVYDRAKAFYEFAVAAGSAICLTADQGGTPGNDLDFQATNDATDPEEYCEVADGVTHLHYTSDTTTIADAVAAINSPTSGTKQMTASIQDGGAGAEALADGDVVAAQDLANGAATVDVRGQGFKVSKIGTGVFRITFDDTVRYLLDFEATLQLATAADQGLVVGTYNSTNKTIDVTIWDKSDAAAADVDVGANNRINFKATVTEMITG